MVTKQGAAAAAAQGNPNKPGQPRPGNHGRTTLARDAGRSLPLQSVDIGGREVLAADAPVSALDLLDDHPGDRAQVLALDLDHGLGKLADHLALLLRVKPPSIRRTL